MAQRIPSQLAGKFDAAESASDGILRMTAMLRSTRKGQEDRMSVPPAARSAERDLERTTSAGGARFLAW